MCGNAIGGALCSAASARRSELIAEVVDGFTLFPMEASALAGQLYFVCGLISPGGQVEMLGSGLSIEMDPASTVPPEE